MKNNDLVKFKLTTDSKTVTKILPYNQYLALQNLCDGMSKFAEEMKTLSESAMVDNFNKKNEDS